MYVVIMAGGVGSRFWPMSRRKRPKQLLPLFGDEPMIAQTVRRFRGLVPVENVLVVTSITLAKAIQEAVPELPAENILFEPMGRNTAPCIGMAVKDIERREGSADSVIGVFPADHYIRNEELFRATVSRAAKRAGEERAIVTLGIEPTHPETGYGYIRHGALNDMGVAGVEAFVEKPDRETALRYLAEGNYLWNAGIFVFRGDVMLEEMEQQLPALFGCLGPLDSARAAGDTTKIRDIFSRIQPVSIDYGVMEGARSVAVIPAPFGWSDVGHWDALPAVAETDAQGNVVEGDVVAIDCRDSVLMGADERVLAAVGLDHVIVVDTHDAVLVAPRSRAQDVRKIVDSLKKRSGGLT